MELSLEERLKNRVGILRDIQDTFVHGLLQISAVFFVSEWALFSRVIRFEPECAGVSPFDPSEKKTEKKHF